MPPSWKRRVFPYLALMLSTASCGDPTGPQFPDVTGGYSLVLTETLDRREDGFSASFICVGSATISQQTGGEFSGSFIINASADCIQTSGSIAGEVRIDGGINFSAVLPGRQNSTFSGCLELAADTQLNGVFAAGTITASSSASYDCFSDGTWDVTNQITATRGT